MHIFCPSPHTQTIIVTNDRKYQTCLIIGFCDRNNKKSEIGLRTWVRVKRGNGKTETEKRKSGKKGKRRKSGKKGKRRKSGKAEKRVKGGKAEKRVKGGKAEKRKKG